MRLLTGLVFLGLLAWAPGAQATPLTTCDQTLGVGEYELTADLVCPGHHAVTLTGGAHLDLKGHQIVCNNFEPGPCVVLDDWADSLSNGTVDAGTHDAIVLGGHGGHRLLHITVPIIDAALTVTSNWNLISGVTLNSSTSPALVVEGAGNWLVSNTALCPLSVRSCVAVKGTSNVLLWTLAVVEEGFLDGVAALDVLGNANWLFGSRVVNLDGIGLRVSGDGNTLQDTTALGTVVDVQDTHGDCTHTTWSGTFAKTADPACIALPRLPTVAQH